MTDSRHDTPDSSAPPPTLAEFIAWCHGEGRGGPTAGLHAPALDAVDRFLQFKAHQAKQAARALQERMK